MLQWLQLPLWLMQLHLTPAACIVYALVANRHRLSIATNAQTGQWSDDQGVYCIYPRAELAAAAGLSITSITRAVGELVAAGLIIDRRLGQGQPNRLYIVDQAAAVPDPVPNIQHADQLTLNDLVPADPLDQITPEAAQAAPDPLDQVTPEAAQAAPDPLDQITPEAAQAAPDPLNQVTPEAAQAAPDPLDQVTPACIEGTSIQESQHPRFSYNKKMIKKNYSDRSNNHKSDNLSAIRRCLQYAYGIDPDSISHDQYTTAAERTSRALDVRNPITYTAAIIAQLVTQQHAANIYATQISGQIVAATEWENEWLDAVRAYNGQKSVV